VIPSPAVPRPTLTVVAGPGLSGAEAARRLASDGPNELPRPSPPSTLRLFVEQLLNTITAVLAAAAVVTTLTGDSASTVVIVAVVVGNATIGVVQQRRAQRALATLAELAAADAEVVRDGRPQRVPAAAVVVGDLVSVGAGDVVPADARLVEVAGLRIDEATLTGESVPVEKVAADPRWPGAPAPDRRDAISRGTAVTQGRGRAVVTATGPRTEVGRIAHLLGAPAPPTPLQHRLTSLGRQIALGTCALCALVFGLGVARGEPGTAMLLTAASLAVAAIPESLPAVVTVALALGAERMARRHAIVRRLLAVETLGSVDVICSDKTGTLTEGTMVVERVWTPAGEVRVTGHDYAPEGAFTRDGRPCPPDRLRRDDLAFAHLCRAAALCVDARLVAPTEPGAPWTIVGDPTEGALATLAAKAEHGGEEADAWERTGELPFESGRRTMATAHRAPDGAAVVSVKGAMEAVLHRSHALMTFDGEQPMSEADRARIERRAEDYASAGYRVMALAGRSGRAANPVLDEDLTFYGLVAMADPPHPQARAAVAAARAAGIRPVMITGDHPATAAAIARRLGILDGGVVVTGDEVAAEGVEGLRARVGDVAVFARTSAEQKVDIVTALQGRGHVVAMTGDGVNDAPALHRADIGVAMGRNGTEVAKQAADMVLADDDFATIVVAVAEGRRIHDNIRRFLRYGLIGGTAEVWVMLFGPLVGLSLPLLAVQILWINLLTHGLPGVALAVEHPEDDAMDRPPRRRGEQLLDRGMALQIAGFGAVTAVAALGVGVWARATGHPWQTMVFTSLTLLQLGTAVAVRSEHRSSLRLEWRGNRFLGVALLATLAAQAGVVFFGPANRLFHTEPLDAVEVLVVLLASSATFLAVEGHKAVRPAARRAGLPRAGPGTGAVGT